MSEIRETQISTSAGPVVFRDFRPRRRRYKASYHFDEKFVAVFCKCTAWNLLTRTATYERYREYTDALRYYPQDRHVQASVFRYDSSQPTSSDLKLRVALAPDPDRNCLMWLPSEERFRSATDQGRFCQQVAERYGTTSPSNCPPWADWRKHDPDLPPYITTHPAYLRTVAAIVEDTPKIDRWQLVKRLQIDPELLDIATQGLLVESRLIDA